MRASLAGSIHFRNGPSWRFYFQGSKCRHRGFTAFSFLPSVAPLSTPARADTCPCNLSLCTCLPLRLGPPRTHVWLALKVSRGSVRCGPEPVGTGCLAGPWLDGRMGPMGCVPGSVRMWCHEATMGWLDIHPTHRSHHVPRNQCSLSALCRNEDPHQSRNPLFLPFLLHLLS